MIIDYNFMGFSDGAIFDTPIATEMIDELQLNQGTYDEVYIDLNTQILPDTNKPINWTMTTIMDSKFKGDLDGGSLGAEGFTVDKIQLFRAEHGLSNWQPIGQFDYNPDYNMYDYVDRYVQNGATYQYAIVPVANEVLGDKLLSDLVKVDFEGIFLTDKRENRRLEFDIALGDVSFNTNSAVNTPINGRYPIVTFGNSNYRSGNLSVMPLSRNTINMAGSDIDNLQEQVNRQEWIDFLHNGKAKVLRMDSGVLMLVVTHDATVTHKEGDILRHLANVSFNYTEIGELNLTSFERNDLIPDAYKSRTTFDDYGGIIRV